MAYKSLPNTGLEFQVETFDPELKGKYLRRYRKIDKRKNGTAQKEGWLIWPVVNGKRYHEFFSDDKYNDSPAESLLAALQRRNEILAMRNPNEMPYRKELIQSNVSGRNGVSFAKERYKTGAKGQQIVHQAACWCATWSEDVWSEKKGKMIKKTTCKKFSIKKYGFWNAYKQAVYARWNWENKMRQAKGLEPQKEFGVNRADWMIEQKLGKNLETEMQNFTPTKSSKE